MAINNNRLGCIHGDKLPTADKFMPNLLGSFTPSPIAYTSHNVVASYVTLVVQQNQPMR